MTRDNIATNSYIGIEVYVVDLEQRPQHAISITIIISKMSLIFDIFPPLALKMLDLPLQVHLVLQLDLFK